MPKIVRCISRKVNGLTEVALPQLFLEPFQDGEERTLPDDVAAVVLNSPCFEEVVPEVKPAAKAASKPDAQPAPASEVK
jgi:hypothetical protein